METTANPSAADPASYNAQAKQGGAEEKRCVQGERGSGPCLPPANTRCAAVARSASTRRSGST